MSRFFSSALQGIEPYVPGEQPKDQQYIKLNTNESPYPPAPSVMKAIDCEAVSALRLYSDPTAASLIQALAHTYDVSPSSVFVGNGSDEVLAFAFHAFGENGFTAPTLSYGFYPVFASFFGIPYTAVPMTSALSIDMEALQAVTDGSIVIANPNAQTGLYIEPSEIEALARTAPGVLIVDEAYIDFGGESVIPLTQKYDNLLVVGTFSKSRNLAGARVGFAIGCPDLIADLNRLKFSFNPYNLNRLSLLAATAALGDPAYFRDCTARIVRTREKTKAALREMGFTVTDSRANFLLAKTPQMHGRDLYTALRRKGILVRYLGDPITEECIRITIGSEEEMDAFLAATKQILEEQRS